MRLHLLHLRLITALITGSLSGDRDVISLWIDDKRLLIITDKVFRKARFYAIHFSLLNPRLLPLCLLNN